MAIELDPKYAHPHNGLGNVYFELGRHDDAIAEYKMAIELDPKEADYFRNLGIAYETQGRNEEALAAYQQAVKVDPKLGVAYASLASIYHRLGNQKEFSNSSQKARELLEPDDHYNWACLEAICGNTDKALEHLKLALEKEPGKREWAKRDLDLEWIRGDERFWEVVAGADDEGRR